MARAYTIHGMQQPAPGRDYEGELNSEQFAAVTTDARHALVIAGAGSGKTRTLTYRVAWLLEHGVAPWRILLLTFTNKAAKEMLTRVRDLVPQDTSAIWGGTFHSIANRILRRHAELAGFTSSFTILDSDDRKSMLKALIKAKADTSKAARFPKAEVLSGLFSLAANRGEKWEDVLLSEYAYLQHHRETIGVIYDAFAARKRESNAMDFDDLLVMAVDLLRRHEEVRERYRSQFLHVLVDEYQDTNALQGEMIDLLGDGEETSLMVVGDDAQSIYSWRGADVQHIFDFEKEFPDTAVFKIETNYRSVPSILELSNAAIAANKRQFAKVLRPARAAGEMVPALVPLPDSRVEGLFVAQRIAELVDSGVSPSDIAVLYRAHFHCLDVQMALTRAGIPFRVTSGVRFFEQAHVKDVMAFLRVLVNPLDEVAFLRVVRMFPKVGEVMARKLWMLWLAELPEDVSAVDGFAQRWGECKVAAGVKGAWEEFLELMDSLRPEEVSLAPGEMLKRIMEYYEPFMQAEFDNYEDRWLDLEQLCDAADAFGGLDEFLAQTALLSNTDEEEKGEARAEVTLSTIHQAKGLEWKVVFLISLCDGMFPHQRVIDEGDPDGMEEELRLFYVAVTRAEDQLYMSYPRVNSRSYGSGGFYQYPSRFLSYCPSDLMEQWEV